MSIISLVMEISEVMSDVSRIDPEVLFLLDGDNVRKWLALFDGVSPIHRTYMVMCVINGNKKELHCDIPTGLIHPMNTTKDATDFTLTICASVLHTVCHPSTRFVIITKDHFGEIVRTELSKLGRTITWISDFGRLIEHLMPMYDMLCYNDRVKQCGKYFNTKEPQSGGDTTKNIYMRYWKGTHYEFVKQYGLEINTFRKWLMDLLDDQKQDTDKINRAVLQMWHDNGNTHGEHDETINIYEVLQSAKERLPVEVRNILPNILKQLHAFEHRKLKAYCADEQFTENDAEMLKRYYQVQWRDTHNKFCRQFNIDQSNFRKWLMGKRSSQGSCAAVMLYKRINEILVE